MKFIGRLTKFIYGEVVQTYRFQLTIFFNLLINKISIKLKIHLDHLKQYLPISNLLLDLNEHFILFPFIGL